MCISFIKILCVPGKMLVKLFYFNVHATGLYPQARKKKFTGLLYQVSFLVNYSYL